MSWEKVKLNDICSSIYDGDHNAPPKSDTGVPFVTISNIDAADGSIDFSNTAHVPNSYFESLKPERRPRPGDVLYSVVGSFGIPSLVKDQKPFVFQRHVAILRPNDRIEPEYLYYSMKSRNFYHWADSVAIGAAQRTVTLGQLREKTIALPPLPVQRRIAGVLSAYDKLIENNRRQIKLLEEAAQRLYKEWFVDLRFPGNETTPIIDGIPEGWAKTTVGDLCLTVGGGTPSTKVASYYNGGDISWVTPTDVTGNLGIYLPKTAKMITGEGLENSSARMIPKGAILMTSRASIGYFAICETNVCTNQGFISSIPHDDDMKWVLLRNLQSRVDEMKGLAKGSTFLEISKAAFRAMPLTIPPKELAKRFSTISKELFTKEVLTRKQLEIAREARDRLLPKLMSGEIEV